MKRWVVSLLGLFMPFVIFANQESFEELWCETLVAYELYGNEKYVIQEKITQINHVLQAASIAKLSGAPNSVVVALLFHDIGQVINEENIGEVELLHSDHAEIGGEWLKNKGFPQNVSDFVSNHALAKVILCQREPAYFASLSRASQISYFYQKHKYEQKKDALLAFNNHPLKEEYLAARKCDDMSKIIGLSIEEENLPGFDFYKQIARSVYLQEEGKACSNDWIKTVNALYSEMIESYEEFEEKIEKLNLKLLNVK